MASIYDIFTSNGYGKTCTNFSDCRQDILGTLILHHVVTVYQFNCGTVALHSASVKNIPVSTGPKNCITILPHHEDFCRRHRITSTMTNSIATPDLPSLPSLQHCLRPFCCLVWSDLNYFLRNCTISSIQILLHGSH